VMSLPSEWGNLVNLMKPRLVTGLFANIPTFPVPPPPHLCLLSSASFYTPLDLFAFSFADHRNTHTMALLASSASLRACARPTVAPRAPVVAPRPVVVCRATAEDALKVAQDLLAKGMDAAKNVDANQVWSPYLP
jgi:hypothetical protein